MLVGLPAVNLYRGRASGPSSRSAWNSILEGDPRPALAGPRRDGRRGTSAGVPKSLGGIASSSSNISAGFGGSRGGYSKRLDTVGEVGSSRREGGEARGAGGGARGRAEPGGEALEVDRGRGGHVLEARPGQPAVAAAAQAEGAHPLRDRALDPGPPRVGAPAVLGREPPPRRRQGLVL